MRRMVPARRASCPRPGAFLVMCAAMCALALGMAACDPASAQRPAASGPIMIRFRPPGQATSVLSGPPDSVAAQTARDLFAAAPVVIVANDGSSLAMAEAVRDASLLHAPLLLASKSGTRTLTLGQAARAEIKRLRAVAVLAVGISPAMVMPRLHGVQVVTAMSALPATRAAAPLHKVAVLVRRGSKSAADLAAAATARAAGARVIFVPDADPRTAPKVIAVLAAARPGHVIGIGRAFGPVWRLAARVAVAETGVQLPGGGQVLFPMRRLVALYGHPYSAALGALGQQGLSASITRVKRLAALYRSLSKVPVVPAFEIIASVAQGASQPEGGTYSYLTPADQLRPWVTAATAAGIYVVLDLQAGRASLLDQARQYQGLLERPNVGLAIDPEWKLLPGELPLQQIGSVSSAQVNAVINWLAKLTAAHHLPQKLLVLHQFRLSMITGERSIDTRHDDLAIVIHMDGQGTPSEKEQTWRAVIGAAPHGIYLGWKNFFVKDHPMLTPKETMDRRPQPVMISYQ